MNYRCIVQYDGTRYEGWQKQKRTEETIQGKLEKALRKITGEEGRSSARDGQTPGFIRWDRQ